MPWLVMLLIGGLSRFIPVIIARVATAAGLGLFTFGTLMLILSQLTDLISGYRGSMSTNMLFVFDMTGIGQACAMITSAFVTRVTLDAGKIALRKVT